MIKVNLYELAEMIGVTTVQGGNVNIQGVTIDSRNTSQGRLFIPLQGSNSDGHHFIQNAIQNGASAALWKRDEPNPPKHFPLIFVDNPLKALQKLAAAYRQRLKATFIGITGSNGKTTTKEILSNLLSQAYRIGKTSGNYNNEIGVPLTILALDDDVEMAVIEMGMGHKGDIQLLTDIVKPEIGLITNVGHAHIVNLGSVEEIAAAKWELVEGLKADGHLFINGDQIVLRNRIDKSLVKTTTFGSELFNDLYPVSCKIYEEGSQFTLSSSSFTFTVSLCGEHQVMNAMAAIGIARFIGLENEQIQKGLELTIPSDKRNEIRTIGHVTIIDDTYKSNPESVKVALHTLYNMDGNKRKLFIMGDMADMGKEEIALHRQVAADLLPEHLDAVYGLGNLTMHTIQKAEVMFGIDRAVFFTDEELLVKRILQYAKEPCIILFKASREFQFERLVDKVERGLQI